MPGWGLACWKRCRDRAGLVVAVALDDFPSRGVLALSDPYGVSLGVDLEAEVVLAAFCERESIP